MGNSKGAPAVGADSAGDDSVGLLAADTDTFGRVCERGAVVGDIQMRSRNRMNGMMGSPAKGCINCAIVIIIKTFLQTSS